MACMKSICVYQLARGKDRTISVILMASLFLLRLQIFLHCVARLGVQNSLGWRYLSFYDCIAFNCIAWQLECGSKH